MIAGAKPQLDFYWFWRRAQNLGFGPTQIWVVGIFGMNPNATISLTNI
jgi:hypothetical protein